MKKGETEDTNLNQNILLLQQSDTVYCPQADPVIDITGNLGSYIYENGEEILELCDIANEVIEIAQTPQNYFLYKYLEIR